MIQIGELRIDDDAVFAIAHDCDPDRFGERCQCCRTYEVCVGADKIPMLDGCIANAIAAKLVPEEAENCIDQVDDGEYALDADEQGLCVLAVPQPSGSFYCSLHTVAMQAELPPYQHKPLACALWPLALSEETTPVLGVTQDALEFPCNRRRRGAPKRLHSGIAQILDALYGKPVRQQIEASRAS